MAYDERLANRIRQAFDTRSDITERKMFGGLAFLYRGRMCCGIVGSDLMVRIPDDEFDAVMRGRHVRPMDFTGKLIRWGMRVEVSARPSALLASFAFQARSIDHSDISPEACQSCETEMVGNCFEIGIHNGLRNVDRPLDDRRFHDRRRKSALSTQPPACGRVVRR
jgi:hypothetical protein